MLTQTRVAVLCSVVASLAVVACADVGADAEAPGVAESAISYRRTDFSCAFTVDEQDIDTLPHDLAPITMRAAFTYGEDTPPVRDRAFRAVPSNSPLWAVFDAQRTGVGTRIFATELTDTAFADGTTLSQRVFTETPRFAAFRPLGPSEVTRDFFIAPSYRSFFSGLVVGEIDVREAPTSPGLYISTMASRNELSSFQRLPAPTITLDAEATRMLLKHAGTTKLTSPNLPAFGKLGCSTKQIHLPPTEDRGLSFHARFCCTSCNRGPCVPPEL